MLPLPVDRPSLSPEETRKLLILPGAPGGVISSAGRTMESVDMSRLSILWSERQQGSSLPAGSVTAGTARLKVGAVLQDVKEQGLSKRVAGRLLRGFLDLKCRCGGRNEQLSLYGWQRL
jgi:hypothetical protein